MSYELGNNIKLSVFGQSHSEKIGAEVTGLPAGEKIDIEKLQSFMERRAPGKNRFSTQRKEPDKVVFEMGVTGDTLDGNLVRAVIQNTNVRSGDYDNTINIPRPGHADYTAFIKYKGTNDMHGGGQFSGRLTAPICAVGGIALQILERNGIRIGAHALEIHGVQDDKFDQVNPDPKLFEEIAKKDFPVINGEKGLAMQNEIDMARENLDSVGGVIECAVTGLPAGIGGPLFEGLEGELAKGLFGIPAVKGVEFGSGFETAKMYGSENNDEFYMECTAVKTRTNHHGGLLGGITSGMPLILKVAVKPTPSIGKTQKSVSLETMRDAELNIYGRHDPCIVHRAVPVVEAVTAIVLLDAILGGK